MPGAHGLKGYFEGGYVAPSDGLAEALAGAPTHAPGRGGTLNPISPLEWEMLARALAAGGFDSPMPVLSEMPAAPDPPSMRRVPGVGLELTLDPRAGRDA